MRRIEELETLTAEERQMLAEVKQAILQHEPEAEVILYGSAARGEREPESDYDVLVLADHPFSVAEEDTLYDAVYDVQLDRAAVISVMLFTRGEWTSGLVSATPYRSNVERDGVTL